jgi:hypothetical protein
MTTLKTHVAAARVLGLRCFFLLAITGAGAFAFPCVCPAAKSPEKDDEAEVETDDEQHDEDAAILKRDLDLFIQFLDADESGKLEPREFVATKVDLLALDGNLDGAIERDELLDWYRARMAATPDNWPVSEQDERRAKAVAKARKVMDKVRRHREAARLMERYDANRDGELQPSERERMPARIAARFIGKKRLTLDEVIDEVSRQGRPEPKQTPDAEEAATRGLREMARGNSRVVQEPRPRR